ncbi:MAG: 16S rRNA (adenine(1518)-N(6)/adenine(1519)-N(6))-dimethyltransferase RsmA [Candidatus Omnitrophica bacterium]|nr:16S rRNA (adenine(1518)-N(6)/adenine(1519)-N(6))-dimethyltransferase RsmA [Candidatus Omnitrophota bacterium]
MRPKPKKRLGQNFLIDKNIQRKIIAACGLHLSDNVLEIGPGRGELTRPIAQNTKKVIAVEIDKFLFSELKQEFKDYKNTRIVNCDILKFDPTKFFSKTDLINSNIKVVGNIPYYISSPIIEHLFKFNKYIDTVFMTVQKEFARRITALPGSKDYGSLTCFVRYYTEPKILFLIKRNSFFPIPKVDSCLLRLKILRHPGVGINDEKLFFRIIRAAFNKRRKILRNSLEGIIPQEKLNNFFDTFNIDCNIRPEDLSLQNFSDLANS